VTTAKQTDRSQGVSTNPWEDHEWASMQQWQQECWEELGWSAAAWDDEDVGNPATDDM